MNDLLEYGLTSLGWLVAGATLAYRWLRRRDPRYQVVRAICGCGHHISAHDPKTNACNASTKQHEVWDENQRAHVDKLVRCACLQYVGPRPIDTLYSLPISTDGD